LLTRRVVVFGSAEYTPARELTHVNVDGFLADDGRPFVRSPEASPWTADEKEEMGRRLGSVFGKLGDETGEEVENADRGLR
jgi:hypothetical protein